MSIEVSDVVVSEATEEQGAELFDRVVREDLGISGLEFIERLETNTLFDFQDEDLARALLLLPFAA